MQSRLIGIAGRALVAVGVLLIVFSFVLGCTSLPGKPEKAKVEAKSKFKRQPSKKQFESATLEKWPAPAESVPAPKKTQAEEELDKQISTLIRALASKSQRGSAQEELGEIGPSAVPALIQALNDTSVNVRGGAASALGQIGPAAKAAVPDLIQALRDVNTNARKSAAIALGHIGRAAEEAVPDLIQALIDKDHPVRRYAAWALGRIGLAAKAAVPDLSQALYDENTKVRQTAVTALGQIGPAAVPALIQALKDTDVSLYRGAILALGKIGPAAKAAVPVLRMATKDEDRSVRIWAWEALRRINWNTPTEPGNANEDEP